MSSIITSMGICVGASTISLARAEWPFSSMATEASPRIQSWRYPHDGDPKQTLIRAFQDIRPGNDNPIAVTGKKFRDLLNLTAITTSEAIEHAYQFTRPAGVTCPAIVAAGGETFIVYEMDKTGRVSNVITGNKCASGTGEFFLQQLRRMAVSLEEMAEWTDVTPFKVSGRCSVFCKSDCSHATGKGIEKQRVAAGLCQMMAEKILELLKGVKKQDIMLTGATTYNTMMVYFLRRHIQNLIIPREAASFEALGCALYAAQHDTLPYNGLDGLFKPEKSRFDYLPIFRETQHRVTVMSADRAAIKDHDECILGLDVGSTTTKAVLIRHSDNRILESIYLRTSGDPIGASQQCYGALWDQIRARANPDTIRVLGLGVCGSGRRIAGLHALSKGIMNEITAHAAAAVFYDPKVDTLFEIGGQDAKYTLITAGVPSDYAMNEACSAGTGSFLEEAAKETLGVKMEDIAQLAVQASRPPNFNDQCAAFIASDIKNAIQEGIGHEDILAGLVYSICLNYLNRVKGNRPVGKKIFMQGGVCYNHAIPLAMAALIERPIIVPPDPGLMGAFGVALVVNQRINDGILAAGEYNLKTLAHKKVIYRVPFRCPGQPDLCDRGCDISVIEMEGKKFPFGGSCDKYYNLLDKNKLRSPMPDLVDHRQRLVFSPPAHTDGDHGTETNRRIVGINRSFLVNTYYPLVSTFFRETGFSIRLPNAPSEAGIGLTEAPFCFPAELSHGFFHALISTNRRPDFIFLPHFKAVPDLSSEGHSQLCPLVQGEAYYLKTTFQNPLDLLHEKGMRLLMPVLDMTTGMAAVRKPLLETALLMGIDSETAHRAITRAIFAQEACFSKIKQLGETYLETLPSSPHNIGVVLFGRAYNAFAPEANKGIPAKFSSRGIPVIPFDCLPIEKEKGKPGLFWGLPQHIYKGAQFVKKHPRLFAVLITSFSCGPDSFLISYFREAMGEKPSLTLELDSHTADAGIETRIEAFLDIILTPQRASNKTATPGGETAFKPARVVRKTLNRLRLLTSSGELIDLTDPRVELIVPSMGKYAAEAMAAVLRSTGFRATAHPPATEEILKLGRSQTLGKECLPMILTTGMLLNAIRMKPPGDKLVFLMPTASGPCRLGQYTVYMTDLIRRLKIPDVAIFSSSSSANYNDFGSNFQKSMWRALFIADAVEDVRSVLLANAVDVHQALEIFEREWRDVIRALEVQTFNQIKNSLSRSAIRLRAIPMKRPLDQIPVISLVGEIFVRRDSLSRQYLIERLAESGFAVICSPVAEWLYYIDLMVTSGFLSHKLSMLELLEAKFRKTFMTQNELRIQSIFQTSGLYPANPIDIEAVINAAAPYVPLALAGEGLLTVGSALLNIASQACGVIAIGPFGCMPNRIAQAILNKTMTRKGKLNTAPGNEDLRSLLADMDHLPFLVIESDGMPFPQIIETKLEAFLLGAKRLHDKMRCHAISRNKTTTPVAFSA